MYNYFLTLLFFCITSPCATATQHKIHVVASIRPIHSLVSAVMGDVETPSVLLEKQQTPHHPTLKPSQIELLQQADIIFMIEPSFETFLEKPLKSLKPNTQVIFLENAPGIVKLPTRTDTNWNNETTHNHHHHEDVIDGHIWLSPVNGIAMTQYIADTLSDFDPDRSAIYQENASNYIKLIQQMDHIIAIKLKPVQNKPFLVFHDGYQYFEKHFNLNGQGAIVFEPDDPLKASRLQEIETDIQKQNIECIFQDTPGNPRIIKMIEQNFKINTAILDPLGSEFKLGPKLYLNLLQNMSIQFVKCLSNH